MTTTVLELLESLKRCPGATKVTIKDVDDQEFAIVGFEAENNIVTIVVGEKEYEEGDGDEKEI